MNALIATVEKAIEIELHDDFLLYEIARVDCVAFVYLALDKPEVITLSIVHVEFYFARNEVLDDIVIVHACAADVQSTRSNRLGRGALLTETWIRVLIARERTVGNEPAR